MFSIIKNPANNKIIQSFCLGSDVLFVPMLIPCETITAITFGIRNLSYPIMKTIFSRGILLFSLESIMQDMVQDSSLALPYWDSTLDSLLPDPCDSVLFTDELMGPSRGAQFSGPFAGWIDGRGAPISRACSHLSYSLLTPAAVKFVDRSVSNLSQLCYCNNQIFESAHGNVHYVIGGLFCLIK